MLSILAGMMIAVGGTVYLTVGGIAGAFLFSMGLLTILSLRLELFTGKAGLLATREMGFGKLTEIWIGNFLGTWLTSFALSFTPMALELSEKATKIVYTKLNYGFGTNLIYGVMCGILMFMAVKTWMVMAGLPLYAMMPVAIFILCGFNHCVADMFYLHMSQAPLNDFHILIPITIGNIIGCNVLPFGLAKANS